MMPSKNILRRLAVENFAGHEHTEIALEKPLALIIGPTGAGKSSLKDGLEFALTGAARVTDSAGHGYEGLIRTGRDEMAASIRLTVTETAPTDLTRSARRGKGTTLKVAGWAGTSTDQQTALENMLGLTQPQIHALLNSTYFFGLDDKAQKSLLFDALKIEYSREEILGFVEDAGERAIVEGILQGIRRDLSGLELLEAIDKALRTARRDAKRELKVLEDQASTEPARTVTVGEKEYALTADLKARVEAQITAYDTGLTEKRARASVAGKSLDDKARLTEELEQYNSAIDAARANLKAQKDKITASQNTLGELRRQRDVLLKEYAAEEDGIAETERRVAKERAEAGILSKIIDHFEKHPGKCALAISLDCDLLDRSGDSLAGFRERYTQHTEAATDHATAARQTRQRCDKIRDDLDKMGDLIKRMEMGEQTIDLLNTRIGELEEGMDTAQKALREVVFSDAKIPKKLEAQIAETIDRISHGRLLLAEINKQEGIREAAEKWKAGALSKSSRVDHLEALVSLFGSDGVVAKGLAEKADALTTPVATTIMALTGGRYKLDFAFTPKFGIRIWKAESGDGATHTVEEISIPVSGLSDGERLLVGVALQIGLAETLGFRLVVIDNAEKLAGTYRGFLSGTLRDYAKRGYQFLLLAATTDPVAEQEDIQVVRIGA